MKKLQLIEITPEELSEMIAKKIEEQLKDFIGNFQPPKPNEYLTRHNLAKMLDVDVSTIHNWSQPGGPLKKVCMGSRVYYLRSDVEAAFKKI